MNLTFEYTGYTYLLALLPVLALVFAVYRYWRNRTLRRLGNPLLIWHLLPDTSRQQWLRFGLLMVSSFFIILALLNPRFPETVTAPDVPIADVVFVVDASTSMLATDVAPNRLARVRQILAQAIATADKSRVGIVVYAAQAYPFLPLTDDLTVAVSFIPAIQPGLIIQQGTRMGKALEMAGYYFSDTARRNQVVFLISDGENHDSTFTGAVRTLAARNIVTHTLGVGTETGSSIQLTDNKGNSKLKTDAAGQPVITRLDADNLRRIAATGHGQYWQVASTAEAVQFITQRLEEARLSIGKPPQVTGYQYLFQWLLGTAFICLLIEILYR